MTGASDAAYATLGLEAGAPFEEVRKRFLTLATQLHPDKATGSTETAHFSTVRCVPPRLESASPLRDAVERDVWGGGPACSHHAARVDTQHGSTHAVRRWCAWRREAFEQIAEVQRASQPTAAEALVKPTFKACGAAAFSKGEHELACDYFQQVGDVNPLGFPHDEWVQASQGSGARTPFSCCRQKASDRTLLPLPTNTLRAG
jgi:hypothetical protein